MAEQLSERERALLDFERLHWRYQGSKETATRDVFGVSLTRYYQQLHAVIDRPEALAHDPVTVNRLRRLRDSRAGRRTSAVR